MNRSTIERPGDRDWWLVLLHQNFELIRNHAIHIQARPDWFYCEIPRAVLSAPFVPGYDVPLGVLVMLWGEGKWLEVCRECCSILYILGASGNVLTGTNRCWGLCLECGPHLRFGESRYYLGDIYKPAAQLLEIYDNRPVVVRSDPEPWSWTKTPAYSPEPVAKRPIEPASLTELIEGLESFK